MMLQSKDNVDKCGELSTYDEVTINDMKLSLRRRRNWGGVMGCDGGGG